jgi:hypothetical protein
MINVWTIASFIKITRVIQFHESCGVFTDFMEQNLMLDDIHSAAVYWQTELYKVFICNLNLHWIVRIKSTSAYENIWIYYTIIIVNLLCLWPSSGTSFYKGYFTKTTKQMYKYKILSFKYGIYNTCKYKIQNHLYYTYMSKKCSSAVCCITIQAGWCCVCSTWTLPTHINVAKQFYFIF